MFATIKKLFWISRPVSWVNTAFPFAVTYLVASGRIDAMWMVGTLFFLIPYNLFMYGINDVFDYESDIRNPRKGGIEGMREQRSFHPTIVRAATITTVPPALYLLWQGTATSNITLLVLLFLVLAYSAAHLRFKEIPFVDSATSSAHFVGPMVYALTLTTFPAHIWLLVGGFFCWGMASHALGAVQDVIPDRKAKIASIATVLGARTTVRSAALLYGLACALVALYGGNAAFIAPVGLFYIANVLPYWNIDDRRSSDCNLAWRRFIWLNLFTGFVVTIVLIIG